MKGKDILRDLSMAGRPSAATMPATPPRSTGAVRAMGLGLDRLTQDAARAKDLQQVLEHGDHVLQLDPALIDPSFVRDRIPAELDPEFDALKASIAASGQQVPVLVRPHPERQGRYQAAYGHRRIRAARDLQVPVRAVVKALSDTALITAQAQENNPRLDLSFIERARFALGLTRHGFDRETVGTALGVDKTDLSRLLSVATSLPEDIVTAIGPAPKIGRPRWLALVAAIDANGAIDRARSALASPAFRAADTNHRFQIVSDAAASALSSAPPSVRQDIVAAGQTIGYVETGRKGIRLSLTDARFAAFISERLPELVTEFFGPAAQAAARPRAKGGARRPS